jgi:hypothetical protein
MFNLLAEELKQKDRSKILKQIQEGLKQIEQLNKKLQDSEQASSQNRESSQIGKRYSFDIVFDSNGNGSMAGTSGQYGTTGTQHVAQFMSPTASSPVQQASVTSKS